MHLIFIRKKTLVYNSKDVKIRTRPNEGKEPLPFGQGRKTQKISEVSYALVVFSGLIADFVIVHWQ